MLQLAVRKVDAQRSTRAPPAIPARLGLQLRRCQRREGGTGLIVQLMAIMVAVIAASAAAIASWIDVARCAGSGRPSMRDLRSFTA